MSSVQVIKKLIFFFSEFIALESFILESRETNYETLIGCQITVHQFITNVTRIEVNHLDTRRLGERDWEKVCVDIEEEVGKCCGRAITTSLGRQETR